jgi:uncharacterized membrane protein YdbT with pleckstrin-like domain
MKFLSNFDTELQSQVVHKYVEMYGKESVFCIHRAKIFWVFYCFIPTLALATLVTFLILLFGIDTGDGSLNALKNVLVILAIAFVIFVGGMKILKKYFDYKMDFCVITPQEIASYNQSGILRRNSRTIDADKIKTVTVDWSGFVKSFFNFGDIRFLSEGDTAEGGDITLHFVFDPNETKNKVRNLIEPHLQEHINNTHEQDELRASPIA